MAENNKESRKKILTIGAVLIFLYWALNHYALFLTLFTKIVAIIMPFIIGGVLAFILNVPMKQIEQLIYWVLKKLRHKEKAQYTKRKGLIRGIAYIITLILVNAVLVGVFFIVIPQLGRTIGEIVMQIPIGIARAQEWVTQRLSEHPQILETFNQYTMDWQSILSSAMNMITTGTGNLITGGIGAVSGIVSSVTSFVIGFVFSIYILLQKESLSLQMKKILYVFLPENRADWVLYITRLSATTFEKFLTGQCVEALILGSMFVIAMSVFRMPYAFLIGVVIAVTALIPMVGAFIGCAVGFILIALVNPLQAVGFVVLFLVLQQIEGNLIYPHVVGNSVGLPGIWVLVAVTVGGNLFGIVGMLTFIPICSVVYALFRTYIYQNLSKKHLENLEEK